MKIPMIASGNNALVARFLAMKVSLTIGFIIAVNAAAAQASITMPSAAIASSGQ